MYVKQPTPGQEMLVTFSPLSLQGFTNWCALTGHGQASSFPVSSLMLS